MKLKDFNNLVFTYFNYLVQNYKFVSLSDSESLVVFKSINFHIRIYFDTYSFELNLDITRIFDQEELTIEDICLNSGNKEFRLFQTEKESLLEDGVRQYSQILFASIRNSSIDEFFNFQLHLKKERLTQYKKKLNYNSYSKEAKALFDSGNFIESVKTYKKIINDLTLIDKKRLEIAIKMSNKLPHK